MLTALLAHVALAGAPALTIAVVDEAGDPVPTAFVYFAEEGSRHLVHGQTGLWAGSVLHPGPDQALPLASGTRLNLLVGAPGYTPRDIEVELDKKRRNHVEATLAPMPAPALEAEPAVADAWKAWTLWGEAKITHLAGPTQQTARTAHEQRERTAQLSEAWISWARSSGADPTAALAICRTVHLEPHSCGD